MFHILEKVPKVKVLLKYLRSIIYRRGVQRINTILNIHSIDEYLPCEWKKCELFFGYYDKPAENSKGLIIVNAIKSIRTNELPSPLFPLYVLIIDKQKTSSNPIMVVETYAYNWQQGCRAQWLDDDCFIVNHFSNKENKYISKVYSVKLKSEIKSFEMPVQDSYRKKYFLSINYRRVMTLRPDYGYRNIPLMSDNDLREVSNDGIWIVDYNTSEVKLLFSLLDIIRTSNMVYPQQSFHKVNHIMISPNGENFIFIHRYYYEKKRYDRLLLANIESRTLVVLADNEMVSHCNWMDNETLVAFLRSPEGIDAFYKININNKQMVYINDELFNKYGDGHPTFNGRLIISDSYEDKGLMRHLICFDTETNKSIELGCFLQPAKFYGECRCDLHPRFSSNGKSLYFDSVFNGKRGMYYMNVDNNINL